MKRDVELIRQILIETEKFGSLSKNFNLSIEGYSEKEISYHVKILAQAGFVEAEHVSCRAFEKWSPISLTWPGHEFLDAARDNTVWNKTKAKIGDKLPGVGFDIFKMMLTSTMKQHLGLEL